MSNKDLINEMPSSPEERAKIQDLVNRIVDALVIDKSAKDSITITKEDAKEAGFDPTYVGDLAKISYSKRFDADKVGEKIVERTRLRDEVLTLDKQYQPTVKQ